MRRNGLEQSKKRRHLIQVKALPEVHVNIQYYAGRVRRNLSRSELARRNFSGLGALRAAAFPINAAPIKQAAPIGITDARGGYHAGGDRAGGTIAEATPTVAKAISTGGALLGCGGWRCRSLGVAPS
jgi:hypothetical protein